MGRVEDILSWTRKKSAPFTVLLIISLIASSIVFWLTRMQGMDQLMLSTAAPSRVWTFLTYPWANWPFGGGLSLSCFVFLLIWLFQVGTTIEREIGTPRFMLVWFGSTLLAGVFMLVGANLLHLNALIGSPYLPESAVTVVWCVRNRTSVVNLFGFLPLTGYWLGWATALINLFLYGASAPQMGVLACLHLIIFALYAADKFPFWQYGPGNATYGSSRRIKVNEKEATTRGQVRYDQSYFDEVKRRETERAEQERLRKLFGE